MSRGRGARYGSFPAVLRGYRADQVDDYLDAAEAALAAGRHPPEPPVFDTSFRGYHRGKVDEFVADVLREG